MGRWFAQHVLIRLQLLLELLSLLGGHEARRCGLDLSGSRILLSISLSLLAGRRARSGTCSPLSLRSSAALRSPWWVG